MIFMDERLKGALMNYEFSSIALFSTGFPVQPTVEKYSNLG